MRVQIIAKPGSTTSGTSRHASELYQGLQKLGDEVSMVAPSLHPLLRLPSRLAKPIGIDLEAFFASYPIYVSLEAADVYHIVTQTMATLLSRHFPAPVIVTVHDIIPYIVRNDPKLNTLGHIVDRGFYHQAIRWLDRADALVAVSEYTKSTLIEYLQIPAEKIHVVYNSVDLQRFRPLNVPDEFRQKYQLPADQPYILYVGSEDPRKNLPTLLRAFTRVKQQFPKIKLIKAGTGHFPARRRELVELTQQLKIDQDVLFLDTVPEADLPLLYNAADLVVMPSLYEGFGYPVIEALACGKPVTCANTSSLKELAAIGGCLTFDPLDEDDMADKLEQTLMHSLPNRPADLSCFASEAVMRSMQQVYHTLESV